MMAQQQGAQHMLAPAAGAGGVAAGQGQQGQVAQQAGAAAPQGLRPPGF